MPGLSSNSAASTIESTEAARARFAGLVAWTLASWGSAQLSCGCTYVRCCVHRTLRTSASRVRGAHYDTISASLKTASHHHPGRCGTPFEPSLFVCFRFVLEGVHAASESQGCKTSERLRNAWTARYAAEDCEDRSFWNTESNTVDEVLDAS